MTITVGDRVRFLPMLYDTRQGTIVALEMIGSVRGARVHWDNLPDVASQWVAAWKLEVLNPIDALGGLDAEG